MLQTLRKSGGSLLMTIPKAFVDQHDLKAGDDVDLEISADSMTVKPANLTTTGASADQLVIGSAQSPTHIIHMHGGFEIKCAFKVDLPEICLMFNSAHMLIDQDVFTIIKTNFVHAILPIETKNHDKFTVSFANGDSLDVNLDAHKFFSLRRFTDSESASKKALYPRFELIGDAIIHASQITGFCPTL